MSSDLPSLSGKEVIVALEKAGFHVARIKGSHHVMKKPGYLFRVSVPVHGSRSLAIGTLLQIIRSAGLSREAFLELI